MSESMPNSWRTDTFRSGGPATSETSAGDAVATFMNPPRPPHRKRGPSLISAEPYKRSRRREKAASDQLLAAQKIVGLDDLAQFLLRRAVAAVGVGMVALDQVLVAGLD